MDAQELNERIAVDVMGYKFGIPPDMVSMKWWRKLANGYVDIRFDALPDYSGYIQYAWLVVDALQSRGVVLECLSYLRHAWYCNFEQDTPHVLGMVDWGMVENQPSPSIAICNAALKICEKLRIPAGEA